MKKILFLIPNLAHGGAEKVLVNLANNLDRTRYDVTVRTLFDVGVNREKLKPHVHYIGGWKKQLRGYSHLQKLLSPQRLYRMVVREQYDVVISYLEGTVSRIISGCQDPCVSKVCWIHTELTDKTLFDRCFRNHQEAVAAYDGFDRIVGVSQQVADSVRQWLPSGEHVTALYNTNETEEIIQKARIPVENQLFCIGDGVKTISAVGKLIPVKGFDRLLHAHQRLLQEGFFHRLYILGIGEEQERLESLIAQYRIGETCRLLGYQENPYQYVANTDIFVCSSRREGFSTAVTESLILGTPVVSTDCSGARELLGEHDEYGLVVENSEEGIYQGMKKLLGDPALLAHYREQAAIRGKRFSKEKTVQAVEEMLDAL